MDEIAEARMSSWAAMIRQRNESGMTVRQWCEANRISENTYYYRLNRLRKAMIRSVTVSDPQKESMPSAHPTEFARIMSQPQASSNVALRIRHADTTIEVSNDASDRILEFLRGVINHAV